MSNSWIFYTQLLSLFTYVGIALGLYALLVNQKDATIQFLEKQLEQAKEEKPDIVLKKLHERVQIARDEMNRLAKDKETLRGFNESQRVYIDTLTLTVKEQQAQIESFEKAEMEKVEEMRKTFNDLKNQFRQMVDDAKQALNVAVDNSSERD